MAERKKNSGPPGTRYPWLDVPTPTERALQVYAFDPSTVSYADNRINTRITVQVPWEEARPGSDRPQDRRRRLRRRQQALLPAGRSRRSAPAGERRPRSFRIGSALPPADGLCRRRPTPSQHVRGGAGARHPLAPGRSFRRIERERRRAAQDRRHPRPEPLSARDAGRPTPIYSPQAHGILFGYFTANKSDQGRNLPGQRVFTCLSHDIIAHEMTHAIIDGIRTYFTEPTNPDVLAFHEGFADLCCAVLALLPQGGADRHDPAHRRAALSTLTFAPAADDRRPSPATRRARSPPEMRAGQSADPAGAAVRRGARRGAGPALGARHAAQFRRHPHSVDDPHFRGSILVAAVFDAFFSVYMRRTADLFRIYRAGGGRSDRPTCPGRSPSCWPGTPPTTAKFFFRLCARALDYCPPVDVTFGDFLRALITVATGPRAGRRRRRARRADGGVPPARHLPGERELLLGGRAGVAAGVADGPRWSLIRRSRA